MNLGTYHQIVAIGPQINGENVVAPNNRAALQPHQDDSEDRPEKDRPETALTTGCLPRRRGTDDRWICV